MAFLTGWDKRIKITADNTVVDSDLSHFPLTVRLGTAVGIGDVDTSCVFDELTSDANRKKIAVTKADGETQLYVEIEQWDDANEKAVLHCGITGDTLSSASDTEYYLYYDVDHADNTDYVGDTNSVVAESVWDANFEAVYHLADGASTSATYDSTSNDLDGVKKGANEPNEVDGKIAKAQDFDGTDDYIDMGDVLDPLTNDFTVTAWIKLNNYDDWNQVVAKSSGGNGFITMTQQTTGELRIRLGSTANKIGIAVVPLDTWTHITYVFDRSANCIGYINGTEIGTLDISGESSSIDVADTFKIGLTATSYIDGTIDEARTSTIVRTTAWIKVSYNSGNDSLLTYGSEETAPSVDTGNFFQLFN